MMNPFFNLRRLIVPLMAVMVSGSQVAMRAEDTNSGEHAKPSLSAEAVKLKELFSDMPDYAATLPLARGLKTPPRLVAGNPPASPGFPELGKKVLVTVCVAINEQGDVAAARVFKSDDARCDPLAVDAIRQWKFAPATNGTSAIKCVVQLPVEFVAPPPGAGHLEVNLGPLAYDIRGLSLQAPIQLKGLDLASIKAARVTVTRALDDTGGDLKANGPGAFFHPAVGGPSDEGLSATQALRLSIGLRVPEKSATRITALEGVMELVMPGRDPLATANISQVVQKLGSPLVSGELAAAHVRISVLDKTACLAALANGHDPADLRGFLWDPTPLPIPGWKPPFSTDDMTDTDLALAIDDPEGRLVGTEFQTIYGAPVIYNHNGWAHLEKTPGKRLSLYRLKSKITDNIKLVCWLATDQSVWKQNFNYTGLPLPPPR